MLYDITYMWNIKNETTESIHKKETDSQTQKKKTYASQRGEGEEGQVRSKATNRYKLLYAKQISNEDVLYNRGNYSQYLIITYNRI